jgi:hypothetical protein
MHRPLAARRIVKSPAASFRLVIQSRR